jgi:hypothetical protein
MKEEATNKVVSAPAKTGLSGKRSAKKPMPAPQARESKAS